jgi:hypothetical protein
MGKIIGFDQLRQDRGHGAASGLPIAQPELKTKSQPLHRKRTRS